MVVQNFYYSKTWITFFLLGDEVTNSWRLEEDMFKSWVRSINLTGIISKGIMIYEII